MIGRKSVLLVAATAVWARSALAFGSTGADGKPETPKRVLIVLFDQMRPEYADRFDMTNFQKLRGEGTDFDKAYLGYMGSETVISHNVIVSGQQPKHMGWVDEAYRDTRQPARLRCQHDAHHGRPLARELHDARHERRATRSSRTTCTRRSRARSSSPWARSRTPSSRPRRPRRRSR